MANSTAKPSSRSKDSSQKQKQPPIRIDEQEQGRNQPGRQHDSGQQGSQRQQSADLNDNQSRSSPSRQQGDDHQQSRQQGRNLPEGNQQDYHQPSQLQQGAAARKLKGEWQQQVGNAKVLWGKLTDDEILKTEGRADKLAGLIQERYAVSQDAADAQVKKFLADSGDY